MIAAAVVVFLFLGFFLWGGQAGYINVQGCSTTPSRSRRKHSNHLLSTVVDIAPSSSSSLLFGLIRLFPRLDVLFKTLDVALQPLDGRLKRLETHPKCKQNVAA
jgi:hypothetical protein